MNANQQEYYNQLDVDEIADRFRELIMHENDLINHRLTWLLTIQGLLFTALGIYLNFDPSAIKNSLFIFIIALAGGFSSLSSFFALSNAEYAINKLENQFNSRYPDYETEVVPIIGLTNKWDKRYKCKLSKILSYILRPCYFLPIFFIALWIIFIASRICF